MRLDKMSQRPRRHIIVEPGDYACFSKDRILNFAYDEDAHATRILKKVQLEEAKAVCSIKELYSTNKLDKNACFLIDGEAYALEHQAVFNRTHYLYHDWWIMAADIGCVYDYMHNCIKYVPISAYCKALQCHTLPLLNQLNSVCLAQIWARSLNDKISQCSMSYCTGKEQKVLTNFDLGKETSQSSITKHSRASRYLNLSFAILPDARFEAYVHENDAVKTIVAYYKDELPKTIECTAYAYTDDPNTLCTDAEGYVELSNYGCTLSYSRVYLKNGIAKFSINTAFASDEFGVGLTVHLKDAIVLIFKKVI